MTKTAPPSIQEVHSKSLKPHPKGSIQELFPCLLSNIAFFFVKLDIHNIYPYMSSWGESGVLLSRSLFIYVYIIVNREMIIQATNKKPILEFFQISTLFPFLFFSELH